MARRPTIVVTNDDGIASPGLHALVAALRPLGTVWVVAPERERGAVGHALTLHKPLRLTPAGVRMFAVNGTPSDCVTLAVTHLLAKPPALVVSGINRGVNLGDDVTYSGTVSGAFEAALLGVPAIAVSQEVRTAFRVRGAADYARRVARVVLSEGLPPDTLLNINVPDRPLREVAGACITALSRRRFIDPVVEKVDPRGRKYYWIAGRRVTWERRSGSDVDALRQGMVSITPLHLDLTDHDAVERFRREDWVGIVSRSRASRSRPPGVKPAAGTHTSSLKRVVTKTC